MNGNKSLTLPSTKVAGFSFHRALLRVRSLMSSPRAFKESVCPAASVSQMRDSILGFRIGEVFCRQMFYEETSSPQPPTFDYQRPHRRFRICRYSTTGRLIFSRERGGFLIQNTVKQQLEEKPVQREKSSPWVGFVQLGMICATIVAIVFIIWGQC